MEGYTMSQHTETKEKTKMVNGVNVDELFGTIDAVKKAPVVATFRFRAGTMAGRRS
jgi:hypothetical protein